MTEKTTRYFKFWDGTAFWKHLPNGSNFMRLHDEKWGLSICSLEDSVNFTNKDNQGMRKLVETTAEEAEP